MHLCYYVNWIILCDPFKRRIDLRSMGFTFWKGTVVSVGFFCLPPPHPPTPLTHPCSCIKPADGLYVVISEEGTRKRARCERCPAQLCLPGSLQWGCCLRDPRAAKSVREVWAAGSAPAPAEPGPMGAAPACVHVCRDVTCSWTCLSLVGSVTHNLQAKE